MQLSKEEVSFVISAVQAFRTSALRNVAKATFPEIEKAHSVLVNKCDELLYKLQKEPDNAQGKASARP